MSPKAIFEKHGIARVDLLPVDTAGFADQITKLIPDLGMTPSINHDEPIHLVPDRQDAESHCSRRRAEVGSFQNLNHP